MVMVTRTREFDLEDMRQSICQFRSHDKLASSLSTILGVGRIIRKIPLDEQADLRRLEGMISSMTLQERRNPDIIDRSRQRRIALGSGSNPNEISQLVKQIAAIDTIMRQTDAGRLERLRRAIGSMWTRFLN
jgi:signal recognition particle subunit SRP54